MMQSCKRFLRNHFLPVYSDSSRNSLPHLHHTPLQGSQVRSCHLERLHYCLPCLQSPHHFLRPSGYPNSHGKTHHRQQNRTAHYLARFLLPSLRNNTMSYNQDMPNHSLVHLANSMCLQTQILPAPSKSLCLCTAILHNQ
jgi:hypothetical protein